MRSCLTRNSTPSTALFRMLPSTLALLRRTTLLRSLPCLRAGCACEQSRALSTSAAGGGGSGAPPQSPDPFTQQLQQKTQDEVLNLLEKARKQKEEVQAEVEVRFWPAVGGGGGAEAPPLSVLTGCLVLAPPQPGGGLTGSPASAEPAIHRRTLAGQVVTSAVWRLLPAGSSSTQHKR